MWSLEQDEGAREIFVCPISRYVITIGSSVGYGLIRRKEIGKTEGEEKKRRDEGRRGGGKVSRKTRFGCLNQEFFEAVLVLRGNSHGKKIKFHLDVSPEY